MFAQQQFIRSISKALILLPSHLTSKSKLRSPEYRWKRPAHCEPYQKKPAI